MPFLLRSGNGLVFTSRDGMKMVRNNGLHQEFIARSPALSDGSRSRAHCPQQNGIVERLIRSLKEQCVHRQRFESLAHESRAIRDWTVRHRLAPMAADASLYNHRRPYHALGIKTPAAAFKRAAKPVQIPLMVWMPPPAPDRTRLAVPDCQREGRP
ncbi:MAG: integrase core domain-containing protein [Pseudomonadota bacterium]